LHLVSAMQNFRSIRARLFKLSLMTILVFVFGLGFNFLRLVLPATCTTQQIYPQRPNSDVIVSPSHSGQAIFPSRRALLSETSDREKNDVVHPATLENSTPEFTFAYFNQFHHILTQPYYTASQQLFRDASYSSLLVKYSRFLI
jgi:hypothetical protein